MNKTKSEAPEKVDFDNYAGKYESTLEKQLNFFGEENSYFAEYKVQIVRESYAEKLPLNILEFGCGIGRNLKFFSKYFPDSKIYGCDISQASLDIAHSENPDVTLFPLTDENKGRHDNIFDLVFISCVFHHIAPDLRNDAMSNIFNMLNQNGIAFIFEHNPYNPVTRHIVNTCEWDTDAILLNMTESVNLFKDAGLKVTDKNYTLFFPAQLGFLRPAEKLLKKIPMGGQYYVKGEKV